MAGWVDVGDTPAADPRVATLLPDAIDKPVRASEERQERAERSASRVVVMRRAPDHLGNRRCGHGRSGGPHLGQR